MVTDVTFDCPKGVLIGVTEGFSEGWLKESEATAIIFEVLDCFTLCVQICTEPNNKNILNGKLLRSVEQNSSNSV